MLSEPRVTDAAVERAVAEVLPRVSAPSVHVRPARAGEADALAPLLYEVNPDLHDRFAGSRERALRLIAEAFDSTGYSGSAEVVRVAEVDGRPAGVMGCYPDWEGTARGRADVGWACAASAAAPPAAARLRLSHAARDPGVAARGAVRGRPRDGAGVQAAGRRPRTARPRPRRKHAASA